MINQLIEKEITKIMIRCSSTTSLVRVQNVYCVSEMSLRVD